MLRLLVSAALMLSGTAWAGSAPQEVKSGDMVFSWKVEGDTLQGKVRGKTEGWVAVGFHATSKMKDALIVIGFVKDGKAMVEEHFGNEARKHIPVKDAGCPMLMSASDAKRDGEFTEMTFTIPLSAQDKCRKPLSLTAPTQIILARGKAASFIAGHPFAKTLKVNLGTGEMK